MTIGSKYLKVLEINKIKIYKAEDLLGFGRNTIKNAVDQNRLLSEEYHKIFMTHFRVSGEWWDTGKPEFLPKKLTDMPKPNDSNGKPNPDEVWSQVEKSEKYTVVPTIILDKYEILSNREIESREITLQEVRATMKIAIAAKDEVITSLKRENAGLREQLKSLTPPQQAQ